MQIDRQQLLKLCEQRGWKPIDLAAHACLSRSFVSQVLSGKREPSPVTVAELARVLDVKMDDLLVGYRCPTCGQRMPVESTAVPS